ncbi:MAG: hypothetical protein ACRCX2_15010 [Paraclostridium sp.]
MSYKQNKLLRNIQEFDKVGDKYNINGIDLKQAIFFWRINQEMYDTIPKGSYTITTEGNNTFLNILDVSFNYEKIQICYEFASISSEYNVDFNVDVNILKDRYNDAVEDIKSLYSYIKSNMMIADGQDVTMILPALDNDEVWIKTKDGYRGFAIGNLEANIEDQIKKFQQMTEEAFKGLLTKKDEYVLELETVKNGQQAIIEGYITNGLGSLKSQGDYQVSRVISTGEGKITEIQNKGDIQSDRLTHIIANTNIDSKLILMNQMFDIIIGSNRYLNGNDLSMRDMLFLDRNPNGQQLSTRTDIRSSYDGGLLSSRVVTIPPSDVITRPITIDLGGI